MGGRTAVFLRPSLDIVMDDGRSNASSKDYLVSLMFSHYDLNNNRLLESQELAKVIPRSVRHSN